MSPGLARAAEARKPYLHKPLDDMMSFFFVALWTTIMHPQALGQTAGEKLWRDNIRASRSRESIIRELKGLIPSELKLLSPLVQSMHGLLVDWDLKLDQLDKEMRADLSGNDPVVSNKLLCFDRYAYRGVNAFVDLLIEHRPSISTTPFVAN